MPKKSSKPLPVQRVHRFNPPLPWLYVPLSTDLHGHAIEALYPFCRPKPMGRCVMPVSITTRMSKWSRQRDKCCWLDVQLYSGEVNPP